MAQADGPPERNAVRVERLLVHEDPQPADRALARFAAEMIVVDRPDAGFGVQVLLMRAKLKEAGRLKRALYRLPRLDSAMSQAAEGAADALREARLDDVESALADAENANTDFVVRVSARCARGEAALVRGDATQAAAHIAAAADYFAVEEKSPEIAEEATLFRCRAVGRLIEHADTFGGDGGWIGDAMELCRASIRACGASQWDQGARRMDMGAAQLSAGRLKDGTEALDLFIAAERDFGIAARVFGRDRFPKDWAAAQNARGAAKANYCRRHEEATGRAAPAAAWTLAEECYASAMEVRKEAGESVRWAKTCINCGHLLLHRGVAAGGDPGQHLRRSVDLCRGAQQALRPDVEMDIRVDAQHIVVEAFLELAEIDRNDAENHLAQAMTEMRAAQEVSSGEDIPPSVADRDRLLARLPSSRA